MPQFCQACGAPLVEGTAFCGKCGAAVSSSPQQPSPQQPAAAAPVSPASAPPAKSGGGCVKIVIIVLVIFAILGAIAAAGAYFLYYKVKTKVQEVAEVARESGIDLSQPQRRLPAARRVDPCTLATKEEVASITGVSIERMETEGDACHYFVQSGGALAGGGYIAISVQWRDGGAAMMGIKVVMGAAAGQAGGGKVEGIADEAIFGPMDSFLMFRKGDTAVTIDLRTIPDKRDKAIALAKLVAGRM